MPVAACPFWTDHGDRSAVPARLKLGSEPASNGVMAFRSASPDRKRLSPSAAQSPLARDPVHREAPLRMIVKRAESADRPLRRQVHNVRANKQSCPTP